MPADGVRVLMGSNLLLQNSFGANLFDSLGVSVDWFPIGVLNPDPDDVMIYRRALSYQRPFNLLLNTNFSLLNTSQIESYMQYNLFYGNCSFNLNLKKWQVSTRAFGLLTSRTAGVSSC